VHVLLICPDAEPASSAAPRHAPHHAALVAAALRRGGHAVSLIDAALLPGDLPELAAAAAREAPDVLLFAASDYNRAVAPEVLESCVVAVAAACPEAAVAGFGRLDAATASGLLAAVPSLPQLAFGEPDFTTVAMLSAGGAVPGVAIRAAEGIRSPDPLPVDLDASPVPAWDLIDLPVYGFRPHQSPDEITWPVLASRGCPYPCFWCEVRSRPAWTTRSPNVVVDEIVALQQEHGAQTFFLADPLFGLHREWVRAFCADLTRRAPTARWTCMTRTDRVDEPTLRAMARAGCRNVLFGVESMSPAVLAASGKRLDPSTVAPALAAARKAGLESVVSLMVGLPGDDPPGFERTVEDVIALDPDFAQFFVVKVAPERAPDHGRVVGAGAGGRFEFPGSVFAADGFSSEQQLQSLQKAAWRRFYLRPRYVGGRMRHLAGAPDRRRQLGRLARGARLALRMAAGRDRSGP